MKTLAHIGEYVQSFPKKTLVLATALFIIYCAYLLIGYPYVTTEAANGPNLIQNPSLEEANPTNLMVPLYWSQGGWGKNTTNFSYPDPGQDSNKAGSVSITTYSGGDAKLVFDHVPVVPGMTYQFGEYYKSNTITELVVEYTKSNGKFKYVSLGAVPASEQWTSITRSFTVPDGIGSATVFHILKSVGTLTIDTASLSSQDVAMSSSGNLISNPSVESSSPSDLSLPLDWFHGGWGINSAIFTYPSTPQSDTKGLGVRLTSYSSGDVKWYFKHVQIMPEKTYTFSDYYQSDVPTTVTLEYEMANGSFSYVDIGSLPASATWKQFSHTFKTPKKAVSVSVFHHVDSIGFLNTDNFSLVLGTGSTGTGSTGTGSTGTGSTGTGSTGTGSTGTGSTGTGSTGTGTTGTGDIISPIISIISPTGGSYVGGTTNLVLSGSDNVGITAIHYTVTNSKDLIVGQISSAPYTVQIPITALKNGQHTITAYAEDAAGNIGNATPVKYTTFYVAPPPETPNLILNPSFEDISPSGVPLHWFQGSWGTNTVKYNYPIVGGDGGRAAEVNMTARTSGDAKWYFEDIKVIPGEVYTFTNQYKSTVPTTLNIRYTNTDGTTSNYVLAWNIPASPTWQTMTQAFKVPENVTSLTIFHYIDSVGTLAIDNAKLSLGFFGPLDPNAFPTGLVSLTFDDGWSSQYDSAFPILNAAGIQGNFYIITDEMKVAANANRIQNSSFETTASGGTMPAKWTESSTGANNTVFTYPVAGVVSAKAAKIDIVSYTSGEAKWQSQSTTIVNGQAYNFSDRYKSTVSTTVTVEYTMSGGTKQFVDLGIVPASSTWAMASFTFTPPAGVKTMSVYHKITNIGSLTTDDYYLDLALAYMDTDQVKDIYLDGHEVSTHTRTHPFLTQLTSTQAIAEISGSRQDLLSVGITPADTFVYPYGDYNNKIIQNVKDAGYIGARSVNQGYNTQASNKYALYIQEVNSGTTVPQMESWIQAAMTNHTWVIFMFHHIDHQGDDYSTTPEDLQALSTYIETNNIPTVTMRKGLQLMNP